MRQQRTRQVAASVALLVGGYFVYRYVKRNGKNAQWFDRIHLRAPKKEEIIIVKSSEDADAAAEAIIARDRRFVEICQSLVLDVLMTSS